MRLIRLRIRNIASLKGEHEIDFLEIQKNSSLFAITGETGSGKSTVLNSIGLALYGQIYKKNVQQLDVVTLGEREGSIELIFQVKGQNYFADWKARVLKQNGEPYSTPQTPVRNLYTIEGEDFSGPKVISKITAPELLNLDFDQFCKCIILNQGEFARFLTSSFTERKHILEKLYPGELLDNISKELDQEKKGLEKDLEALQIELATLKGDDQSGGDLKAEKSSLEKRLKHLEEQSAHLEKLDYHFTSLFSYYKRFNENEQRKKQVKDELSQETSRFNLLLKGGESVHEKFEAAKRKQDIEVPLLQKFLEKEGNLKLFEENRTRLVQRMTTQEKNLKEIKNKFEQKESEEKEGKRRLRLLSEELTFPVKDLRAGKDNCEELFDLFSEKEILTEEIKGKKLKLSELESRGLELKTDLEQLEKAISALPANAPELEAQILKKKEDLQKKIDQKQRALIAYEETKRQIENLKTDIKSFEEKIFALNLMIAGTEEELLPLEATLKLSEVLNAAQVCVEHVLTTGEESCPVCERALESDKWGDIKTRLAATDLQTVRKKFEEKNQTKLKAKQEVTLFQQKSQKEKETLADKEKLQLTFQELIQEDVPTPTHLDQELNDIRKKALELAQLRKEQESKVRERDKLRSQFKILRDELCEREKFFSDKSQRLLDLSSRLSNLLPELNRDGVRDLKTQMRLFSTYEAEESSLEKLIREKEFLQERKQECLKELEALKLTEREESSRISEIKTELETALKGEKASELIHKINALVKSTSDDWSRHLEEQNKQEQALKGLQGKLYTLDELTKDFDLQFTKELHTLRTLGDFVSDRNETQGLLEKTKNLSLTFDSPISLFIPMEELIQQEKIHFKEAANECRMQFASVSTKLSAWEKLQDKIQITELKAREVNEKLQKKLRLFEVLGKDELRNFVLSLVEENLIYQTNDELQKLCQGRYEIIHQTKSMKMVPEFFILDKFREGGKRKVSTLSGGETFMVSLAMALGLAEMTRGKAEIDSLFIDEGFGTLDQESLEDVLDMLQQIQTRGLMVGIISHIKTLTNAIPVNLVLNKKNDGTSIVSMRMN